MADSPDWSRRNRKSSPEIGVAHRFTAATSDTDENEDAPLLKGTPPIGSGKFPCVRHGVLDATASASRQDGEATLAKLDA
jgi:hypothetical protein